MKMVEQSSGENDGPIYREKWWSSLRGKVVEQSTGKSGDEVFG